VTACHQRNAGLWSAHSGGIIQARAKGRSRNDFWRSRGDENPPAITFYLLLAAGTVDLAVTPALAGGGMGATALNSAFLRSPAI
jgi:hypothetical protein